MLSFRALCVVFAFISVVSTAPQDNAAIDVNPLALIDEPRDVAAEPPLGDEDSTTPDDKNSNELTTAIYDTESDNTRTTTKSSVPVKTQTEANEKKKPSPRFLSKLSYFKSSEEESDSNLLNFIEKTSKRRFRSRCRCEKITNCPKLQISVPRCPEDYFLCCF